MNRDRSVIGSTLLVCLQKARHYWSLMKSLQTVLLLVTGIAGYFSSLPGQIGGRVLLELAGSLFLAVSGSTVLNMWYDRDIDARMQRTCWRPLPKEQVTPSEALVLGIVFSVLGVAWSLALDPLYGFVVLAGVFSDVFVYTIWLKRRTAWSIVWGGISGGMPVLAGRVLGMGAVDWIGVLLALAVLFWIPTHIMTFNMRYFEDYQAAGIPTFPAVYGYHTTRRIVAFSSLLAAAMMGSAALGIGLKAGSLHLLGVLSVGLLLLAGSLLIRPSDRVNFHLFKYASVYMLCSMLLLIVEAF